MTFKAQVYYQKEYYNRTARATIPASWKGEIIEGLEHLNNDYTLFQVYSYGDSREEVIKDLIQQLKELGLSGKLKIV